MAVDPTSAADVYAQVAGNDDSIINNAVSIFNVVVGVVLAVVALGILITFAKRVKRG